MQQQPYPLAIKNVALEILSQAPLYPMYRITRCTYPAGLQSMFHSLQRDFIACIILSGKICFQEQQKAPLWCTRGSTLSIPNQCTYRWAINEDTTILHIHHKGYELRNHGILSSLFGEINRHLKLTKIKENYIDDLSQQLGDSNNSLIKDLDLSLACLQVMVQAVKNIRTNWDKYHTCPLISNCLAYIESNLDRNIKIKDIAKAAHSSPTKVFQLFQQELELSPLQYITKRKTQIAHHLLTSGRHNATEVAKLLGFNSPSYFSRFFKKNFGHKPSDIL